MTGRPCRIGVASVALAHIAAINDHRVADVVRDVAGNVCYQVFPGGGRKNGREDLRQYWTETFKQVPDIHFRLSALMKDDHPLCGDARSGAGQREVFARGRLTGIYNSPFCIDPGDHLVNESLGIHFTFDRWCRIVRVVTYCEGSGLDLYELARDHIERENRIDLPPLERARFSMETVADDASYTIYPTGQEPRGKEELLKYYADSFKGIANLHIDIQHMIKDEEKRQVLCQYRITGVHKGDIRGLMATNRMLEFVGVIIYEFNEAGKLAREMNYFEENDVLAAMGLIHCPRAGIGQALLIFPQSPIYILKLAFRKLVARFGGRQ